MKSIMLSIQPKYCELIASGKKTIEVRKTAPKFETPFKCYIYCAKQKRKSDFITKSENFGCITGYESSFYNRDKTLDCNGKVIGEFVCDWIKEIEPHCDIDGYVNQYIHHYPAIIGSDCLSFQEMKAYLGCQKGYDWHISDLKIYDEPKELGEFRRTEWKFYDTDGGRFARQRFSKITRPPQSWCYVEEL